MTVLLYEAQLQAFFHTPGKPVPNEILRRAEAVRARAFENATGRFIDVDTGDLIGDLKTSPYSTLDALAYTVGSGSRHKGLLYPAFVTRFADEYPGGWLKAALRFEFPDRAVG